MGKLAVFKRGKRNLRSQVHTFKGSYYLGAITEQVALAAYSQGFSFTFNQLPNCAFYGAVFDQYRIIGIRVDFRPTSNAGGLNAAPVTGIEDIYTSVDYDDVNPLNTRPACLTANATPHPECGKPFHVYWKPRTAGFQYISAIATGYSSNLGDWIDMANQNVLYYGLKVHKEANGNAAGTIMCRMTVTLYFQCRNLCV